jgi:hypothetical protein
MLWKRLPAGYAIRPSDNQCQSVPSRVRAVNGLTLTVELDEAIRSRSVA